MAINRDQWPNNRQQTALVESKKPLTQKHCFLNCSSKAKTIDRVQKSPTQTEQTQPQITKIQTKQKHSIRNNERSQFLIFEKEGFDFASKLG
jgi:hypothetical protein